MIDRLRAWALQMLICVDQIAGCWLRGWVYVWIGGEQPKADETISSWVGRRAIAGFAWALVAERLIDLLFGAGHCRRAAAKEAEDLDD